MPEATAAGGWLSAHLYYGGPGGATSSIYGTRCDEVILTWIGPIVEAIHAEGHAATAFFIRYTDHGGPHVRLRVLPDDQTMHPELSAFIVERAASWRGGELAWIPYEPEYDRYGGPAAMPIAERCFDGSSRLALLLLKRLAAAPKATRLGYGLMAMLTLVHAFLPDVCAAARFSDTYFSSYLNMRAARAEQASRLTELFDAGFTKQAALLCEYVATAWSALSAGEELDPDLDQWYAQGRDISAALRARLADGSLVSRWRAYREWTDVVAHILPSYVHMTSNRLGISIPEEIYLARIVARALEAVPA